MDDRFTLRPLARWYMIAAIASLLFMVLGCAALAAHLAANPASLPLDQRALFEAEPGWILAASGVGLITGAAGGLLLVLRKRAAEPLMLISFLAMCVWLAGMFATPAFRDLLPIDRIAIALVAVAVVWTIYWFARHSRQRGWLR
ncbi:MAG: hypothetical protein ACJ8FT_06830 [Sphingomonas sp.]